MFLRFCITVFFSLERKGFYSEIVVSGYVVQLTLVRRGTSCVGSDQVITIKETTNSSDLVLSYCSLVFASLSQSVLDFQLEM